LALPIEHPGIETIKLFTDRFLLTMPTSRRIANRIRATPDQTCSTAKVLFAGC